MTPPADTERYKNHRFPGEIISHGVWLYYRFTLSYRDVEELLFERGITVSHEAIRKWCQNLGRTTPIGCDGGVLSLAINGIWTRSS
jgi:transposase-like protein